MWGSATSGSVSPDRYAYPSSSTRGTEREAAVGGGDVPELDERQQEPARGRAGQPGEPRDLAQRQLAVLGIERADDREPALERLHEVCVARSFPAHR